MKRGFIFLFVMLSLFFMGCDLLYPKATPKVEKVVGKQSLLWRQTQMLLDEGKGVNKRLCEKVQGLFKGSGYCDVSVDVFGKGVKCVLGDHKAFKSFVLYCDRVVYGGDADFYEVVHFRGELRSGYRVINDHYGQCEVKGAGLAVGESERFGGDVGYLGCFYDIGEGSGTVKMASGADYAVGLYLDLKGCAKDANGAREIYESQGACGDLVYDGRSDEYFAGLLRFLIE